LNSPTWEEGTLTWNQALTFSNVTAYCPAIEWMVPTMFGVEPFYHIPVIDILKQPAFSINVASPTNSITFKIYTPATVDSAVSYYARGGGVGPTLYIQ
jgi:hypothetical protein